MEKANSEKPFLASDLVPPGSESNYQDLFGTGIPVLTWSKGRPLADENELPDESCDGDMGDLDSYWPQPGSQEGEGNDANAGNEAFQEEVAIATSNLIDEDQEDDFEFSENDEDEINDIQHDQQTSSILQANNDYDDASFDDGEEHDLPNYAESEDDSCMQIETNGENINAESLSAYLGLICDEGVKNIFTDDFINKLNIDPSMRSAGGQRGRDRADDDYSQNDANCFEDYNSVDNHDNDNDDDNTDDADAEDNKDGVNDDNEEQDVGEEEEREEDDDEDEDEDSAIFPPTGGAAAETDSDDDQEVADNRHVAKTGLTNTSAITDEYSLLAELMASPRKKPNKPVHVNPRNPNRPKRRTGDDDEGDIDENVVVTGSDRQTAAAVLQARLRKSDFPELPEKGPKHGKTRREDATAAQQPDILEGPDQAPHKSNKNKSKSKSKISKQQKSSKSNNNNKESLSRRAAKSALPVGTGKVIADRHKTMLQQIVAARRLEDEKLMMEEQKIQARRKKFKEALLDKAMRARNSTNTDIADDNEDNNSNNGESGDDNEDNYADIGLSGVSNHAQTQTPGFLGPTKAFVIQSQLSTLNKKKAEALAQAAVTEEELAQAQLVKRDQIVQIRRKFKEKHKQALLNLDQKNKDSEKKMEEDALLDALKKEKHRKKVLKILAAKRLSAETAGDSASVAEFDTAIDAVRSSMQFTVTDGPGLVNLRSSSAKCAGAADDRGGSGSGGVMLTLVKQPVAGSALVAVRSRSSQAMTSSSKLLLSKQSLQSDSEDCGLSGAADCKRTRATRARAEESSAATRYSVGASNAHIEDDYDDDKNCDNNDDSDDEVNNTIKTASKSSAKTTTTTRDTTQPKRATGVISHKQASADVVTALAVVTGAEETEEEKQARKAAAKAHQAKMSAYFASVSEQKKKDEADKVKKAERMKKRVALLSQRLLQEASERKQMSGEDAPQYRLTALESSASGGSNAAPATKFNNSTMRVTTEMTEALVARLGAGKQTTSSADNSQQQATQAPRPPPPHVPHEPRTQPVPHSQQQQQPAQSQSQSQGQGQGQVHYAVPVRDFADWKRKNSVPANAKVFAMTGWYPCVKQALLDRGWHCNSDLNSPYFDLKWTLRSIDVCQDTLLPWQLTNHFLKNVAITTKVGLLKSLESMVWLADVSCHDILPRGFDLSSPQEMQAFIDDFRCQKAECILKLLYKRLTGLDVIRSNSNNIVTSDTAEDSAATSSQENAMNNETIGTASEPIMAATVDKIATPRINSDSGTGGSVVVNQGVFDCCCLILERQLRPLEDNFLDQPVSQEEVCCVKPLEWEIISTFNIFKTGVLSADPMEAVDGFLQEKADESQLNSSTRALVAQAQRRRARDDKSARDSLTLPVQTLIALNQSHVSKIHDLLHRLHSLGTNQAGLNGQGDKAHNLWIVKPAAKSRGRGITTFCDLPKLLKYVEAGTGLSTQWIVQKYMENPLVISNRKFDLRQWVVVTDWNPLTVYFYNECYARFSVEEYSTDEAALENAFIHLVNNSIGKNSENFNKTIPTENGDLIEGYMLSFESFRNYLKHKTNTDIMMEKIHPRMKDIAKWSLMCASEMIEHRKNSWELYGFDFMVDDDYNAWLIEINSSPACDYSTKVTERYVQKALVELLAVVLDVREWEKKPNKANTPRPDTGGWECVYKGPLLETPVAAFGTDLSLRGEAVKNHCGGGPKRPPAGQGQTQNQTEASGLVSPLSISATGFSNNNNSNNNNNNNNNNKPTLRKSYNNSTSERKAIINNEDDQFNAENESVGEAEKAAVVTSRSAPTANINNLLQPSFSSFNDSDSDGEGTGAGIVKPPRRTALQDINNNSNINITAAPLKLNSSSTSTKGNDIANIGQPSFSITGTAAMLGTSAATVTAISSNSGVNTVGGSKAPVAGRAVPIRVFNLEF